MLIESGAHPWAAWAAILWERSTGYYVATWKINDRGDVEGLGRTFKAPYVLRNCD
jgi:hypothetical protein